MPQRRSSDLNPAGRNNQQPQKKLTGHDDR